MTRLIKRLILSIGLLVFGWGSGNIAQSYSMPAPTKTWVGEITYADGAITPIVVTLDEGSSSSLSSLSIQPKSAQNRLSNVKWQETTLVFDTSDKPAQHFVGQFDGKRITGSVDGGNLAGKFSLIPLLPIDATKLEDYVGVYRLESGAALGIQVSPSFSASGLDFFWPGLALNHFATGAVRGLYPIAPDVFLLGSARVVGYPFKAQITFDRNTQGKISGLRWQEMGTAGELSSEVAAAFVPVRYETVRYKSSDGITLVGLLTLPTTPGAHPAMVVLHGSEQGTRDDFGRQQLSRHLVSQGFAVLTYDKRGVGDSEGRYQENASETNLKLLAQDALAGVALLKQRADIDATRIGLIGYSQAGWIIPLAAQSPDVRFFVNLSGPVVSVGIENAYSRYTNNGDTESRYSQAEISKMLVNLSPSGFDPQPILSKLEQQGLWIWGDQDKSIPVPESVANLKLLIESGKRQYSYRVLKNADHNLQQTTKGLFSEIPYSSGYPAEFYETLNAWLAGQIK